MCLICLLYHRGVSYPMSETSCWMSLCSISVVQGLSKARGAAQTLLSLSCTACQVMLANCEVVLAPASTLPQCHAAWDQLHVLGRAFQPETLLGRKSILLVHSAAAENCCGLPLVPEGALYAHICRTGYVWLPVTTLSVPGFSSDPSVQQLTHKDSSRELSDVQLSPRRGSRE